MAVCTESLRPTRRPPSQPSPEGGRSPPGLLWTVHERTDVEDGQFYLDRRHLVLPTKGTRPRSGGVGRNCRWTHRRVGQVPKGRLDPGFRFAPPWANLNRPGRGCAGETPAPTVLRSLPGPSGPRAEPPTRPETCGTLNVAALPICGCAGACATDRGPHEVRDPSRPALCAHLRRHA
jgi:hypothetical protein